MQHQLQTRADNSALVSESEPAIKELLAEKAIMDGKLEIVSNILHDIGNAVVGFASYIGRIKRSLEQSNPENLQKMVEFFTVNHSHIAKAMGEEKATAVIRLLSGISEAQRINCDEIRRSISDQLNIVAHIQEILHIHRQYGNDHHCREMSPMKLKSLINDCIAILFASIEKREIRISIDIPDDLPDFKGDRTRLMQVVLNVLKNSIEALDIKAREKNISIHISTLPDLLLLKIQDNGCGFDSQTGEHLFERGFTTKASGSGRGLNSSKAIIESHGGTIEIASEGVGKGALTTIKFKI